jgi:AmiR/NasT family two-component response regulator
VSYCDPAGELTRKQRELAAAAERAEHLERALVNSRRIGMALGILMERHRLTEAQAFDQLTGISSRRNVKLHQVAEELVYTGDPEVDPPS